MGIATLRLYAGDDVMKENFLSIFSVLYALNMYFQSFGAVAIVKCNAPWFHVRERGVFGAIFGILISLGIYFAFDVGYMILRAFSVEWVFFIPAILLVVFFVIDVVVVRNTPGEAGHEDFDTADASSGDDGPQLGAVAVFRLMLGQPVVVIIAFIEFCSGFLRQAIMQWYRTILKQTGLHVDNWVYENWGMLLCCAGILGGVIAGIISDRMFQSRRGPVAGFLYGVMLAGAILLVFVYKTAALGALVVIMSMAVIGVHGMLSGTASMDFGGKKNVGVAVGIIDGFVYAGTGVMSLIYGQLLPVGEPAKDINNYLAWPIAMIPVALVGLGLSAKIWNAKPKGKTAAAH
jgi:OPA family glycerol-3-phosphate transporter-like MFS transporter